MFLWTCLVSTNIYIFISISASVSESLYSDNDFHTWRRRSMVHCKCFFRGGQSINTRWQKCLGWWWYLHCDEAKWRRWWSNVQMCHSGWLSPWIPEYHSPSPSLATAMTNTKYRYKKNLINNINASQQCWKLTNTNVSMGFWAKKGLNGVDTPSTVMTTVVLKCTFSIQFEKTATLHLARCGKLGICVCSTTLRWQIQRQI